MSATATHVTVRVLLATPRQPGRKTVVTPVPRDDQIAVRTQADPAPIKTHARAFRYQKLLDERRYTSISEIAAAEKIERGYLGSLLRLTLLAPELVEAIPDARQPEGMALPGLLETFPAQWSNQRQAFGPR